MMNTTNTEFKDRYLAVYSARKQDFSGYAVRLHHPTQKRLKSPENCFKSAWHKIDEMVTSGMSADFDSLHPIQKRFLSMRGKK